MELYIHIPFCRKKCRYCDFASWAGREAFFAAYAEDVCLEAVHRKAEIGAQTVETVYIGGGTPSVMPADILTPMLRQVLAWFTPEDGAEFTSEANPGTLTHKWLEAMRGLGMNRLSLGMQAAQPSLLRMLGRIHTQEETEQSVRMAREAGIRQLNLDLMFGLPGQTRAQWRETLDRAVRLEPEHLSCYGLIPEEGTALKEDLDAGRLTLPEEDEERAMYDDAISVLRQAGYRQYEISNFARPGCECRHNVGYWRRVPYLGLGIAAASMLPEAGGGCRRETNPRGWEAYHKAACGTEQRETERVDPAGAQFETMMLGLRMNEGVNDAAFFKNFGVTAEERYGRELQALEAEGLIRHEDGCWRLTRQGMDIQNTVLVRLME